MNLKTGDTITFRGDAIPQQISWAGTDYPTDLIVGQSYTIETVKVFRQYTHITLNGVGGVYNSTHFIKE